MDDFVNISTKHYNELLRCRTVLYALQAYGVDNWEWYGDAMDSIGEGEDEESYEEIYGNE